MLSQPLPTAGRELAYVRSTSGYRLAGQVVPPETVLRSFAGYLVNLLCTPNASPRETLVIRHRYRWGGTVIPNVNLVDAPHRRVVIEEVRAHRDEIYAFAERYDISNVRVFGSVACGEADENSDLDLLVDPGEKTSLWDLSGFALDVEELLKVFTQVATPNGLKARMRDRILAEAVHL